MVSYVTTKIKSRQVVEFPTAWDESTTPYALNQFTPSARTLSEIANADQLSRLSSSSSSSGRNQSSIHIRLGKAVFVGDVGVGKTSIINRFCRDIFQQQYSATIGVDYEIERFWILNIPYNLQVWDTAGQERFKCIASAYYRGANIIVTVFDASNLESLSTCQKWMDDAVGSNRITPLRFLVGTKIDLVNESHQDKIHVMGLRMANIMGAEYWPVSSKTGSISGQYYSSLIGGVSVTIAVVTLLLVWIFYEFFGGGKNGLTKEEIQEFLLGNSEAIRKGAYAHENANYMPYRNNYEVPQDKLYVDRKQLLGSGQYGEVFLGRYSNGKVAVKTVKPGTDKMYLKALLAELKIMIYLGQHSNIVSVVGASTSNLSSGRVYIIVDFCEMGSLDKYLKKHKQNFVSQMDEFSNVNRLGLGVGDNSSDGLTTKDLILWSSQIAKAMGYLESKKVIHGDLATRNVLLSDRATAKLTDFGLSRQLYDYTPNYVMKNMEPLPWRWMSYESLRELTFSSASDVWAMGVTIWEIFTLGDVPFAGLYWTNEFVDSLANGFTLSKPTQMTHDMYCQLLKCWNLDPAKRPKFAEMEVYLNNALAPLNSL